MKYKIKKRHSGSYTIVCREHWYNKWMLCPIYQLGYINPADEDELATVWPHFKPFKLSPLFQPQIHISYLEIAIDMLKKGRTPFITPTGILECDRNIMTTAAMATKTWYRLIYIK